MDVTQQAVRDQLCDRCLLRLVDRYPGGPLSLREWRRALLREASMRGLLAEYTTSRAV